MSRRRGEVDDAAIAADARAALLTLKDNGLLRGALLLALQLWAHQAAPAAAGADPLALTEGDVIKRVLPALSSAQMHQLRHFLLLVLSASVADLRIVATACGWSHMRGWFVAADAAGSAAAPAAAGAATKPGGKGGRDAGGGGGGGRAADYSLQLSEDFYRAACEQRSHPPITPCCAKHAAAHRELLLLGRPVPYDKVAAADESPEDVVCGQSECGAAVADVFAGVSDEQVGVVLRGARQGAASGRTGPGGRPRGPARQGGAGRGARCSRLPSRPPPAVLLCRPSKFRVKPHTAA
ncbi:hypothetical protein MNEG_16540 [Monoraphidium neglectum]|uniref:Uncharacterized protein n=1 Tax=Monoraphidium neglectum TaxID=145388 RepID=A0A0D2LHB8_9CHLO|nr:hypothetical protein MNEG_16540 [Monoraphidium neglectum]KIY91424.1 hypothetical protein MNEG_16540 [Monoraphidium neglectum]|eukprot:XP_013890444.1 hypothetical protein MNEG_16540 [Monoraphidium neglectum]